MNQSYHFEMTPSERRLLIRGLLSVRAGITTGLMECDIENLLERLEALPDGAAQGSPANPIPASEPLALWGKSGTAVNFDRLAIVPTTINRGTSKTKDPKPYLKVSYQIASPGTGYGAIFCWDETLFRAVEARLRERTQFYVVKEGSYLNIVGVEQ